MAFKNPQPAVVVPDSPEKLLLDLPRRKIKGVLLHQGEMMKSYAETAVRDSDVALQLPTGSGKTLVGLMIGEWRRRKFRERIVYLCPTRQLVNQVVEQAAESYGLTVRGFVGKISTYDPTAKAEYLNGDRVAVTTYSALFNTNPFFQNPEIIVVDDAHAAENYIAALWTLRVTRTDHAALHTALAGLLKPLIDPGNYSRLIGEWDSTADIVWADKLPTPKLAEVREEFRALVDAHVPGTQLSYSWSMLRDHT
jgi:replicative superfamily II helicase